MQKERIMTQRIYLNESWKFTEQFTDEMLAQTYDGGGLEQIRIPHTCKETPFNYFDEHLYQMVSGYYRELFVPQEWEGRHLLLTFEGVGHVSQVYLNGVLAGEHKCGYTAFTIDLAPYVIYGADNRIVVKVDSREDQNVPPFGFVIDYMTYGGIYRDVYLEVKEQAYLEDIFVQTKVRVKNGEAETSVAGLQADVSVVADIPGEYLIRQYLCRKTDAQEETVFLGEKTLTVTEKTAAVCVKKKVRDILLWDVEHPHLYTLRTQLFEAALEETEEKLLEEKEVRFGFRNIRFRADGFYINGRKLKLRGLNRHQSYPYVGYAMPKSMQVWDADILKHELGLNAVRTSHYPQSHYFLDRCDELGLLVFTELPGWQHIGDEDWKLQAIENVRDMVKQYRNHTSIMLWGVRINESVDDDAFYERTNEAAHALDPSRQTGGVRVYKKSSLLEDVYTYNDFLHDGKRKGCDRKVDVTPDPAKGYLISEYNGHMYPTKPFDDEEHRAEHALRHANVLNEVAKQTDIAGSFGWCMFDYNTHKDFGSGDRICYHGVMDMFRNAKMAADVYACQQEETPVLSLSSSMDIGEHPGCNRGRTYIFTNADSVKMYKNDRFIKEYRREDSPYKYLKHGPILLDDYVGDALETQEGMEPQQAKLVREVLNEAAAVGLFGLTAQTYLKAGRLMLQYHMKMTDAVSLYNQYVGDWGGAATVYRFEAVKDGRVVAVLRKMPMQKVQMQVQPSTLKLAEDNTYDVAAVRIRATDEHGNLMPYFSEPVVLQAKGAIELIGPSVISLKGGMGGTFVKTVGRAGEGRLLIKNEQMGEQQLTFEVSVQKTKNRNKKRKGGEMQ